MGKLFSIINNKGGTGKTTTAANLGAALARLGKRVLLIDMDSQCNLSASLGLTEAGEHHIGTLLLGQSKVEEAVVEADQLWLIPSVDNLLDYETRINNEPGREYLLREALEPLAKTYDYLIVDCPPSLGALSINALVASDYFIVPMQTENFAFIGLDKILDISEKVKKRMNPQLKLGGILLVKYSQRTRFGQAIVSNLENNDRLGDRLFKTAIRQDIALMEAAAFSQTIFEYAPKSRGAGDFKTFAKELMKKCK